MRFANLFLSAVVMVGFVSCASGPSITRTAKGGYHATSGHALLAKQDIEEVTITTAEGDVISVKGKKQNASNVANTGLNWWGIGNLARLFYGAENLKVTEAAGVEKAKVDAGVQGKRIDADVWNNTSQLNSAHGIPAQYPNQTPLP